MHKRETFEKAILSLGIARIAGILFSVGISILISRGLGPEGRGALASYGTVQAFLVLFISVGLGNAVNYSIAANPEERDQYFGSAMVFSIFMFLIYVVATVVFFSFVNDLPITLLEICLIGLWVFVSLIADIANGYVSGMHLFTKVSNVDILSNGFILIVLLAGFFIKMVTVPFVLIVSIMAVLTKLAYIWHYCLRSVTPKYDKQTLQSLLKLGLRNAFTNLLGQLLSRGDVFILLSFWGNKELGLYTNAQIPYTMLMMIPGVIGQVVATKVASNEEGIVSKLLKAAIVSTGIALVACLVIMMIGDRFFIFLYGNSFRQSFDIFMYLIPSTIIMVFGGFIGNALAGKGYPRGYIIASILAFIVNIILNLLFVPAMGAKGAALSASITSFVMISICTLTFYRLIRNKKNSVKVGLINRASAQ